MTSRWTMTGIGAPPLQFRPRRFNPGLVKSRRHRAPTARSLAAQALVRVAKDQAFAAAVLDAAFARHVDLDPRDRALATELTYGALRVAPYIEARLEPFTKRGMAKVDPTVRAHLLVAGYQILFLDRVPAFAAVSEAVELVRHARGRQLGAFANAILRRLAEEAEKGEKVSIEQATRDSAAPWLVSALTRALGEKGAEDFLMAGPLPPPLGLRLRKGEDREAWILRLREALPHASIEAGEVFERTILVRGAGDPRRLPGFEEGSFVVQEEGSALVGASLGASAGEVVLDACAGRGNKTSLLAEEVGGEGAVDAADLHENKLERLREELSQLGLSPRGTYAVDWTVGPGDVPKGYARVLVDAPCSGIGTLRRRPDLATRRTAMDLEEMAEMQRKIVLNAAKRLKPGGVLVYAVCSVLREEAEDVVEKVLERSELSPTPLPYPALRELAEGGSSVRLLPHVHGTDGFFIASFVKK